jgi:transcriptional regulator with XRE-family HTH domain
MSEAMNKLKIWLLQELEKRNMSQSDLAKTSGLTRQAISYYLGDKSKRPDDEALNKIAHALRIHPKKIYEAAGILPPELEEDPWVDMMNYKIRNLPIEAREIAERLINTVAEQEEANRRGKLKPKRAE